MTMTDDDRTDLVDLLARAFVDQASDARAYAFWNTRSPILWIGGNFNIAAILAAVEPAIRATALEQAARLVETHRVAHINRPPFHLVHANSETLSEPDVSQRALAYAIRALADKGTAP